MLYVLAVTAPTTERALTIWGQSAYLISLDPRAAIENPVLAAAVARKLHHINVSEVFWMKIDRRVGSAARATCAVPPVVIVLFVCDGAAI